MSWHTFGHTHIKQILDSQLENDHLAHTYLFTGPSGIGKKNLAEEFAKKIINQESLVDITYYDIAANPSVEDLRHLLKLASLTPIKSGKKVVVLDHINKASNAALSGMLKTLEEPTVNTIFILLSDTARILPTIMSRCLVMAMGRLTPHELAEYVASKNLSVSEEALNSAGGSITRLELLSGDSEEAKTIFTTLSDLRAALAAGSAQRIMLIKTLAELDDELLNIVIESWIYGQLAGLSQAPQRFSAIQVGLETLQRLSANVNKKMALEYFLLNPAV